MTRSSHIRMGLATPLQKDGVFAVCRNHRWETYSVPWRPDPFRSFTVQSTRPVDRSDYIELLSGISGWIGFVANTNSCRDLLDIYIRHENEGRTIGESCVTLWHPSTGWVEGEAHWACTRCWNTRMVPDNNGPVCRCGHSAFAVTAAWRDGPAPSRRWWAPWTWSRCSWVTLEQLYDRHHAVPDLPGRAVRS